MSDENECGPDCPHAHPELGQALFGNPVGDYGFPEYAEAFFFSIWSEIARVYWNLHQKEFSVTYGCDPKIPGIEVRPYYWGEDPDEAAKPNFKFGDVEIRWYKYVGRGMSCNVRWTPDQWIAWFNGCLKAVRDHDRR